MSGLVRVIAVGPILAGCYAANDAAPPPVTCATQTCEASARRAVLFGGQLDEDHFLGDTWTWDGATWTQENVSGPSARSLAEVTTLNGSMVIYGGFTEGNLSDTWSWDGETWVQGEPGLYPIYGGAMSTLNDAAVLYGGNDDWGLADWETWIWNGASWTQDNALLNGGSELIHPSVGAPTNIYGFSMAALNDTVVLFGGVDNGASSLNQTWTWNGTKWSELQVAAPSARYYTSMASLNGTVVLFGGCSGACDNAMSDTWIWDGASWTEANVGGPSARYGQVMATVNDTIVLFGGAAADGTLLNDTWIWDGASWTKADVEGPSARTLAAMAAISPTHAVQPSAVD